MAISSSSKSRPYEKHGLRFTQEYKVWHDMKRRVLNPNCSEFHNYGGRGITICERWMHSFANFFTDMGPRPSPKHSLDRINNDGSYSPENCRWATKTEQAQNTRNNVRLTFGGQTAVQHEWARRVGIHLPTLGYRIRTGWALERALNPASLRRRPPGKWSIDYDCCQECGKTEKRHLGHGLCQLCYHRHQRSRK